jgi:hypothetical protein
MREGAGGKGQQSPQAAALAAAAAARAATAVQQVGDFFVGSEVWGFRNALFSPSIQFKQLSELKKRFSL